MMQSMTFQDTVVKQIKVALDSEAERILAEEISMCQKRVEERLRESKAHITLAIFKNFSVRTGRDEITIQITEHKEAV